MSAGANAPRPDVDAVLAAVRDAGAAGDPKEALAARQARAAEPDVVAVVASLQDGSPASQRVRAGLRELGVTAKALEASVRWWRGQRRARGEAAGEGDRPTIRVTDDLHLDVAAAVRALAADPDLYARAGSLVRVVPGDAGEPLIVPHTAATLRVQLVAYARWIKRGEDGEDEGCLPPDAITLAILEAKSWKGLRVLAGIVETPTLRPDRTVLQVPGYDAPTRLLYLPTIEFPPVPEKPTRAESAAAMKLLWIETSYDFPFRGLGYAAQDALTTDPDGSLRYAEARPFADAWGICTGILTVISRPAIDGDAPAILYDAAGPASGKGLQVDVVSLSTVGRIPEKFTWPNQGDRGSTDAEVGKMLAGAVVEGAQIIVWDEITGAFGGPSINNVLTCRGRTKLRIIGTPSTPTLPYTATMLGAGNNILPRDNTHRRVLVPRLESTDEHPEEHTGWRRADLRASVREMRPALVVAALTVLVGYEAAERPKVEGCAVWGGGFESWSALVPPAMVWAGGGNVMGCRPTMDPDARNEEKDSIAVVIDTIARAEPKGADGTATGAGITMAALLALLYTPERLRGKAEGGGLLAPDGYEDAREAIDAITGTAPGRKPPAKKLGEELRPWKRRPVGGSMLDTAKLDRANVARWTVRKAGERRVPAVVLQVVAPEVVAPAQVPEPLETAMAVAPAEYLEASAREADHVAAYDDLVARLRAEEGGAGDGYPAEDGEPPS